MNILQLIAAALLWLLLLYFKIKPYENELDSKNKKWFDYLNKIFIPLISLLSFIPNRQLGPKLSLNMPQMVLCAILIIIIVIT